MAFWVEFRLDALVKVGHDRPEHAQAAPESVASTQAQATPTRLSDPDSLLRREKSVGRLAADRHVERLVHIGVGHSAD